ncbi:MAG TPA: cyclic 2,3-diphosphoglycerate synthase [Candidatus Limnocylindrales bacterium]|nr:cyclic 2,3-diphosphoglycerate synthase [Candidatus Limnocylindrales bacterium]
MRTERVLIMGAAGRDFHDFNVVYRDDPSVEVVAFTATQIPGIADRRYPPELAGAERYPDGIPIRPEADLEELVGTLKVDTVVFAYSDVSHETVMHAASRAMAAGADFKLLGQRSTMLASTRPVVAVCAVRTGSGKSQTSRYVAQALEQQGLTVAVVRHPMPYGDLVKQRVQRFATYEDLDRHETTIEEREEYEPHLDAGRLVFAGVDYEGILRAAEAEADVVIWDGGNNDLPFYAPDLMITVADPLRPGHELSYHPGETNMRLADVIVINKVDSATPEGLESVRRAIAEVNPRAMVVEARSSLALEGGDIRGRTVAVVEDGPTLTHGGMTYGAGVVAAKRFGASEIVDPRPFATGELAATLAKYPKLERLLPAMGYGAKQVQELEAALTAIPADVILAATPIDLTRVLRVPKPIVRVRYELEPVSGDLETPLAPIVARAKAAHALTS